MRTLSIGFVVPYGEPSDGFFPDTLLAQLCAEARLAGHRASVVRAYYDGRDPARDAEVARRLEAWLEQQGADLVVLERLFDPGPVRAHLERAEHRLGVVVCRGDSFDPIDGIDLAVGALPGMTKSGGTRRSPTVSELSLAFERLVRAVASGDDPGAVPGVSWIRGGVLAEGAPLDRAEPRLPYVATTEQDVISLDAPPRVIRKTLFGNAGCPFAEDPLKTAHYRSLLLPEGPLARLGCAFCAMGGDYEKRSDAEIVPYLVEQALLWTKASPEIQELLLSDQYSIRYLAALVRAAHAAGVRPVRWLFAARADAFVREGARVEQAIAAAAETGHVVEVYLSGFEAFCDAELTRYNKGATVADLLAAIERMRALRGAHPAAFAYAGAKGHSLILWSPWTAPDDLAETVRNVRANGAREIFSELGRNRLRLYKDLPIFYAAERDGALADAWEDGDEGAGRRKGYSVERPWRFLDRRTRLAYELSRTLRDRFGAENEVTQLAAVVDLVTPLDAASIDVAVTCAAVLRGVDALEEALGALARPRPDGGPPRGSSERASVVHFAGRCNNNCGTCANRDIWLDDATPALLARVDEARKRPGPVMLAGREPTMHPGFADILRRAHGADRRAVGLVTNGRRFAYAAFARAAVATGISAASVKLFAPSAEVADAIARAPGGFDQATQGIAALLATRGAELEIRAPLHRDNLAALGDYVPLARRLGVRQIRLECALDAVGLDRLEEAAAAIAELTARCTREGVALDATPLSASTRLFDRYPGSPAATLAARARR